MDSIWLIILLGPMGELDGFKEIERERDVLLHTHTYWAAISPSLSHIHKRVCWVSWALCLVCLSLAVCLFVSLSLARSLARSVTLVAQAAPTRLAGWLVDSVRS